MLRLVVLTLVLVTTVPGSTAAQRATTAGITRSTVGAHALLIPELVIEPCAHRSTAIFTVVIYTVAGGLIGYYMGALLKGDTEAGRRTHRNLTIAGGVVGAVVGIVTAKQGDCIVRR